ncbi:hypothetical protein P7C71_g891, partial [Lecanoromycetidae sp. Uapishka_2]
MAWPNPFFRKTENTRSAWGYTFELSPDHLTVEQMKPMKQSYDLLGEQALDRLNQISSPLRSALPRTTERSAFKHATDANMDREPPQPEPRRDLYLLLQENADKDEILGRLWSEVNDVPLWVDWDQIGRGQDCFYRYGGPALTGLAFQSLLGGMGAARVVETLARTGLRSKAVLGIRLIY